MTSDSPPPPRPRFDSRGSLEEGDWHEHRIGVLETLRELKKALREQSASLQQLHTELAVLKTRMGLYTAGVAVVVTAIIEIASRLIGK